MKGPTTELQNFRRRVGRVNPMSVNQCSLLLRNDLLQKEERALSSQFRKKGFYRVLMYNR